MIGSSRAEPFLRGLRTHRPRLAASLDRVPAVRRVVLAALSPPGRRVLFEPAEPYGAGGSVGDFVGSARMRLSAGAERGAGGGAGLPALVFESFNWHILPAFERLKERAAAGEIGRTDFIRGVAALEQLSFAHQLRVLRDRFGELRGAGFADEPSEWVGTPFLAFQVPPSGMHLRTTRYPHEDYGPAYDWVRSQRLIARLAASPGCRPVAGGAAAWEAAVLLNRLRFYPGRQAVSAPASVRRAVASPK